MILSFDLSAKELEYLRDSVDRRNQHKLRTLLLAKIRSAKPLARATCLHQRQLVTHTGYGENVRCADCGEELGYV